MNKRVVATLAAAFALVLLAALVVVEYGYAATPPQSVPSSGRRTADGGRQVPSSVWTDIAPFPTVTITSTPAPSALRLKRAGAVGYPPNGKLYVLGGRHGTDGEDFALQWIWEYNPASNAWVNKNALLDGTPPNTRYTANMAVAVLTDTSGPRIYTIGGNNINSEIGSDVRVYNPVADSITTLSSDPWPAMPPRIPGGYAVLNNKLYIFGGFSSLGFGAVYSDTWMFDPMGPAGSKWTQLGTASLNLGRAYIAGATLDGKIYAIGGDTWNSSTRQLVPVANVEVLDPQQLTPRWTSAPSLPAPRGDMSAWAYDTGTGYEISGSIVVAGGIYPVPDGKAYRYDLVSGSWSEFPNLAHATRNYGAAQLNGVLYAFGGYDYSGGIPSGANFSQKYDASASNPTPTKTPVTSPTVTGTPFATNYEVCASLGVSLVAGTSLVPGSQCDDCITTINLPFTYTLYDQTFSTARVSSNGTMSFVTGQPNPVNFCLPDQGAAYTIYGFWDDLLTNGSGGGIYTSVSGSAPNRILNVEWRSSRTSASGGGTVNFEIRLYEGDTRFDIVYGVVSGNGNTATAGVQRDIGGPIFTQYTCNNQNLSAGLQLLFTLAQGVCPSPTPTFTVTDTVTGTPPTATGTPTITSTPCGSGSDYVILQSTGAAIDPGVNDIGNHTDDGVTVINLPFPALLYGAPYNTVAVSSNGNLQFIGGDTAYANNCLPQSTMNNAIFAHWDDLLTNQAGGGIFTSVVGISPNRVFNVEWRACVYNSGTCGGIVNFEVRLFEGQDGFDIVYGQIDQGGSSATAGVQRGTGTSFTLFECNTAGTLQSGLQLRFTPSSCTTPTETVTGTPPTATITRTPTNTGMPTNTNTPTRTVSPPPTCGPGADYLIIQSTGAAIDPGTSDIGNHTDDGVTAVALPFPVQLYGQTYTSANVSSNGNIQFAGSATAFTNGCLPTASFNNAIMAHWDDLLTNQPGGGIFTSLVGVTPNRIFNVEWRTCLYSPNGCTGVTVNFEVRLFEGQDRFDIVYGQIDQGGTGATIGVQRSGTGSFSQYSCNTNSLSPGLQLTFRSPVCGEPTFTPTSTITPGPSHTGTATSTPTGTVTPTSTCGPGSDYVITQSSGAAIDPGVNDIGNHTDDGVTNINLPFPVQFYAVPFTTASVSTNGNMQFSSNANAWDNSCLPAPAFNNVILAFWDDLKTDTNYVCPGGCGIYTSVVGVSPNRVFNVEWRAVYYTNTTSALNFEVRLFEGQHTFEVIYGTAPDGGLSATIGVQKGTGAMFTQFECSTAGSVSAGMKLSFAPRACATSTPTVTPTSTPVLVGHVTWQGRPAQPSARQQLPITLTLKSGSTEVNYPVQTTDASGYFTVPVVGLATGQYNWRAKSAQEGPSPSEQNPGFLATSGTLVLSGAITTQVEMGLQRAGDCNNDNVVNTLDFNILKPTFAKTLGDPGYDSRADITGDNVVNAGDFAVFRSNFGVGGAPPIRAEGSNLRTLEGSKVRKL